MGFSSSSILSFVWNLFSGFLSFILGEVEGLVGSIFSGLGFSVVQMFQSFGTSTGTYGIWAPMMFVIGIGSAIMVGYLFLTFIGAEKDVTEVEGDL